MSQDIDMGPTHMVLKGVATEGSRCAKHCQGPQVALGRAIRLRREELGISQQDLGLEVGYDQGWLSHIENGRTNPAYGIVDRIARPSAGPCRG